MSIQSDGLPDWEPIVEETIPLKNEDFLGPDIEEFFPENPCLLEIGPLNLAKLTYGTWLESQPPSESMTPEECSTYEAVVAARNEVAQAFMKYFNITIAK